MITTKWVRQIFTYSLHIQLLQKKHETKKHATNQLCIFKEKNDCEKLKRLLIIKSRHCNAGTTYTTLGNGKNFVHDLKP